MEESLINALPAVGYPIIWIKLRIMFLDLLQVFLFFNLRILVDEAAISTLDHEVIVFFKQR